MRCKSIPHMQPKQWSSASGGSGIPPAYGHPRRYSHLHVSAYNAAGGGAAQGGPPPQQSAAAAARPSTTPGPVALGLPPAASARALEESFSSGNFQAVPEASSTQLPKKALSRRANTFSSGVKRPSTGSIATDMFPQKTAHLEPLVDRCTAVAADYSLMTVEGIQTGEEVFVEPVVAREPPEAVLNLRSAGRDERRLNCSAARNKERKLELEIKRLQSLLNTTNKELGHFKQHCCTLQEEGRSAAAMADEQVDQLRRASLEHSLRLQAAEERYGELQMISADETAALRDERRRRDDACAAADRRASELEKQLREEERERGALTETIGLLRQQCQRAEDALSKRAADTAEASEEMAALKAKDKQREQVIVQMKAALAEEASTSEKRRQELRETWETMVGKEAAAIDLRKKNSMMLEYITKICQPHFAVVKDESLQPVNLNGFQVTQGHVLVPLILLLEGYSLLPTQLRSVIDMKSSQLHNQGSKGINYQTEAAAIPTSALAAGGSSGGGGGLTDSADSYKNRYATAAKFREHAPSSSGFST